MSNNITGRLRTHTLDRDAKLNGSFYLLAIKGELRRRSDKNVAFIASR